MTPGTVLCHLAVIERLPVIIVIYSYKCLFMCVTVVIT